MARSDAIAEVSFASARARSNPPVHAAAPNNPTAPATTIARCERITLWYRRRRADRHLDLHGGSRPQCSRSPRDAPRCDPIAGIRKTSAAPWRPTTCRVDVEPGEIFGLIGPNGAGKTTTMECAEGLRRPDRGTITVLALDPVRDRHRLQQAGWRAAAAGATAERHEGPQRPCTSGRRSTAPAVDPDR
jgi:ABC-type multidrug transport system fused ATPase/permease subunit